MDDRYWTEPRQRRGRKYPPQQEKRGRWHRLFRVESCYTSGGVGSYPSLADAQQAAQALVLTHKCAHVRQGIGVTLDHRGRVVATYGTCPEYARVSMRPVGR